MKTIVFFAMLTILSHLVSVRSEEAKNYGIGPGFGPGRFGTPSFYNGIPDGGFAGPGISNSFNGPSFGGKEQDS